MAPHPLVQPNGQDPVAPSAIPIENDFSLDGELIPSVVPRALELEEIPRIIGDYARAARNALLEGFDGVELHGANGYQIDEFLQDGSNRRDDEYGSSVSNRVRFLDELLKALGNAVGRGRVGLRISPSSTFQSMRDSNPSELWSHVLAVVETHEVAYLHMVEPGIHGSSKHRSNADDIGSAWIRARYSGALIPAKRYEADSAEATVASGQLDAVAFGRLHTSNPDLPERLRERAELLTPHRPTFYTADDDGCIDWPTLRAEALLRAPKDGHIDAVPSARASRPRLFRVQHRLRSGRLCGHCPATMRTHPWSDGRHLRPAL